MATSISTMMLPNTSPLPTRDEQYVADTSALAQSMAKNLKLDPSRPQEVMQIGADVQQQSAAVSAVLLQHVQVKDIGGAGALLLSLSSLCKGVNPTTLKPNWRSKALSMIPGLARVEQVLGGYQDVLKQVDTISKELVMAQQTLMADVNSLSTLYDQNLQLYRSLQVYVHVCSIKLRELQDDLDKRRASMDKPTDEQAQQNADLQALITRLDKHQHDLELTAMIRLQNAPKIRIVQAGNIQLSEKMQSSVFNTIPIWRDNLAIMVTQQRQKEALAIEDRVDDTTNQLMRQSADMLHTQSVGIAKASERGVVDLATLQYTQQQLIATLDETHRIAEEGAKNRIAARASLESMKDELQKKLTGGK